MPQRHGVQAVLPLCCGLVGCCTMWSGSWVPQQYRQRFGIHLPDCTVTQNTTSASMGTSKLIPPGLNAFHPFMTFFRVLCNIMTFLHQNCLCVTCFSHVQTLEITEHLHLKKCTYLFIYGLFSECQQVRLHAAEWQEKQWRVKLKGCARKKLQPDLSLHPGICLG